MIGRHAWNHHFCGQQIICYLKWTGWRRAEYTPNPANTGWPHVGAWVGLSPGETRTQGTGMRRKSTGPGSV